MSNSVVKNVFGHNPNTVFAQKNSLKTPRFAHYLSGNPVFLGWTCSFFGYEIVFHQPAKYIWRVPYAAPAGLQLGKIQASLDPDDWMLSPTETMGDSPWWLIRACLIVTRGTPDLK